MSSFIGISTFNDALKCLSHKHKYRQICLKTRTVCTRFHIGNKISPTAQKHRRPCRSRYFFCPARSAAQNVFAPRKSMVPFFIHNFYRISIMNTIQPRRQVHSLCDRTDANNNRLSFVVDGEKTSLSILSPSIFASFLTDRSNVPPPPSGFAAPLRAAPPPTPVHGVSYVPVVSGTDSLYGSISSLSVIAIGDRDTIWFQGTYSVFVWGRNGLRWNCRVTASPPFTITSNLCARKANKQQRSDAARRVSRSLRIHHPPALVNVNPNLESRSTETRMPIMPSPCGDSTWPRTTDTRLNKNNNVHGEYRRTTNRAGHRTPGVYRQRRLNMIPSTARNRPFRSPWWEGGGDGRCRTLSG